MSADHFDNPPSNSNIVVVLSDDSDDEIPFQYISPIQRSGHTSPREKGKGIALPPSVQRPGHISPSEKGKGIALPPAVHGDSTVETDSDIQFFDDLEDYPMPFDARLESYGDFKRRKLEHCDMEKRFFYESIRVLVKNQRRITQEVQALRRQGRRMEIAIIGLISKPHVPTDQAPRPESEKPDQTSEPDT